MRYFLAIIIAVILLSGAVAHADRPIEGTAIEISDVEAIIRDVVDFFLTVAGLIVVGYMVYGGITMVMSKGNDTEFANGKKILTNAVIGAIVIFGVGVIVNTIADFGEDPTSPFGFVRHASNS